VSLIIATASINFASSWTTFWSSISGSLGKLPTLLGIIGMLLVVAAILTYLWERRRGGDGGKGGHSKILWAIIVGAILAAPSVVIPAILTIVDFVANVIASGLNI